MEMTKYASNKLRSEMREKRITTQKMCDLLKKTFDISLNNQSFNNKIARANFSATFFFQCMYILNLRLINFNLDSIELKTKEDKVLS